MENPIQLSLVLLPENGTEAAHVDAGLSSPMGGKHQRDLSLSAKWASSKALALEYLKRQLEALLWIESVLDRKLQTRDLHEELKSGIVLREVMTKLYPEPAGPTECRSPISRRYSLRMAPWKERENISIFLKQCKALGMNDTFLFCTDDLYEGTNMVQVLFSVQHFMAVSQEKSNHLFKPILHEENITFSNQEVEMALSKIEMAGVEANVLFTSAPSSASPSPAKSHMEEDPTSEDDPSTASSEEEEIGTTEEKQQSEPADNRDAEEDLAAEALLDMEQHDEDSNNTNEEGEAPVLVNDEELHQDEALQATIQDVMISINDEAANYQILEEIVEDMMAQIEFEALSHNDNPIESAATDADMKAEREVAEGGHIDGTELSDLTDKHETYVGDSLAPTVVDPHASSTDIAAESKAASRAARASKKASRAASKAAKKARASSEEQLDEEAMSRCTCGSKCSIM